MARTPKTQSEKATLAARRAWCYLVLVLISFLCLFFFYVLVINSTRTHFEIQKGFSLLPGKSLVTNFRNVLADANIPVGTGTPMWRVMTQARPVFDVQLKKDNEIKLACIDKFMNAAYSDANKFWADFMEQVNILLDSRRYCRECEILGLKPEYVAEHIVFLGSATMKKVLKDGVSRTLGADVQLYGKRFSPEDADRFLSEDIKRLPEQTTVA